MTAYWPGISGLATTPRWDVAVLMAIASIFQVRRDWQVIDSVGVLLISWLVLSLVWSTGRLDGIDTASELTMVVVAFVFGSGLSMIKSFVIGAALGLAVSSLICIAQAIGIIVLPTYIYVGGLFFNGAMLAEVTAIVLVAALALRLYWLVPLLLPSLLLPQARTPILAVALSAVMLGKRKKLWLLVACISVVGIFLARGFASSERLVLWRETLPGLSLIGRGIGSFPQWFVEHAQGFDLAASRPRYPHNELLWLAFEGGVPAVAMATGFVVLLWCHADAMLKGVLIVFLVDAMFWMPLHEPATVLFVAVCAGFAAHRQRDCGVASVAGGNLLRARLAS